MRGSNSFGFSNEGLADAGGHGEAQVGVDVHLGAAGSPGDFDVGLGDAGGVLAERATEFVDFLGELLRDAGGSVEDEGIIAETGIHQRFLDGFQPVDVEVLFALELVGAMAVADGDGEGIDAGFADELDGFVRVGVMAAHAE